MNMALILNYIPRTVTELYFEGLTFLFVGSNPPKKGHFGSRYICTGMFVFIQYDVHTPVWRFTSWDSWDEKQIVGQKQNFTSRSCCVSFTNVLFVV